MIIGLTGKMGSGKGEAAEYLRKKGFEYHVFSDCIREEAKKRGISETRENLQLLGNQLRRESGNNGILAIKLLEGIKTDYAIVDGIRNCDEINELRKRKGFYLVAIDAPQKIRFERLLKRGRAGDPKTFEEFKRLDDKEAIQKGQQIDKCNEIADYAVMNTGNLNELHQKIEEILNLISNGF